MTSGEYAFKDKQTRWHRLGMRPVPYLAESGQLVAVCVLYYKDLFFFFFSFNFYPMLKIPLGLKIRSCCPIIGQTDLYISAVLLRSVCKWHCLDHNTAAWVLYQCAIAPDPRLFIVKHGVFSGKYPTAAILLLIRFLCATCRYCASANGKLNAAPFPDPWWWCRPGTSIQAWPRYLGSQRDVLWENTKSDGAAGPSGRPGSQGALLGLAANKTPSAGSTLWWRLPTGRQQQWCPTSGCQVPLQLERRVGFAVVSPARPCWNKPYGGPQRPHRHHTQCSLLTPPHVSNYC